MTFTEEWFGERSQEVLARLVKVVEDVPGIIIEIGAWEGRSTIALANAAYPRQVHTCDTWAGSPGEISAELAAERDVHATWRANVDELTAGNVVEHRSDWREYLLTVDTDVALAFIDAEHTYVEVRDNIRALLQKMSPGGIICGDDQHHPPVRRALVECFGDDVYVDATVWIWQKPTTTHSDDLAGRFFAASVTPSDINGHLQTMVDLVEQLNARHVIELGTRSGISTTAWLYALETTGGRLTSVDLDPQPDLGGDWPHWSFIQGDDTDPAVIDQLEPAEIVFIDTSHHYQHTKRELEIYRHLVKSAGVIVCHDTDLRHPDGAPLVPAFPVKKAVIEFCETYGCEWLNLPGCYGLGIIKVGWT